VKAFNWPEVRTRVTVDGVIAVIDSEAVAAGRFAPDMEALAAQRQADPSLDHESPLEELFEEQILCADMVVLNKADRVDEATLARVRAEVAEHLRPAVKTVVSTQGAVAPDVLLGLGAAAEDDLDSRRSHHEEEGDDHDHDEFESFVVTLPAIADPAELEARIRATAAAHDILRVKGFLDVAGKAMRHVIQGVGDRIQGYYDRPWKPGEARGTRLVVIGQRGLDRAAIAAALAG
jgi:cobalamin biosynthesis protein CobW